MAVVLTLAQRQEDAAAQRIGQWREQMQQEQQQLSQLQEYCSQYQQEYTGKRSSIFAHQLINYSAFIGRLGDLVQEQQVKLLRMQANLERLQGQWQTCYQKRKSIQDLIERFEREESALLERRLQKELDELSARRPPADDN